MPPRHHPAPRLLALLALLALAPAARAAADCTPSLGLSAAQGRLIEDSSKGQVNETAFWPGIAATWARPVAGEGACAGLSAAAAGGLTGQYDGYTQLGAPLDADVTHGLLGIEAWAWHRLGERLSIGLRGSLEQFYRDIAPSGTAGPVTETYRWQWLGGDIRWQACPGCRLPVTLAAGWQGLLAGSSDVDLHAFGTADVDLGRGERLRLEATLPARDGWPALSLARDEREFAGTALFPVQGNTFSVRQPPFRVRATTLSVAWPLP